MIEQHDVAILTPVRDPKLTTPEFKHAIEHNVPAGAIHLTEVGLPVDEARNRLVERVRALDPRPEFVVWADDDAYWPAHAIPRLVSHLDKFDLVSALHGKRGPGSHVLAFTRNDDGSFTSILMPEQTPEPKLVACDFVGSHIMIHRTALLDALPSRPFDLIDGRCGEDSAFCTRVRAAGFTIAIDATLQVAHIEKGFAFLPGVEPFRIVGGKPVPAHIREFTSEVRNYGPTIDLARRSEEATVKQATPAN
jgi:hypothetical protein